MLDYSKLCGDRYLADLDSETGRPIRPFDPHSERIGAVVFVAVPQLLICLWLIFTPLLAEHIQQSLGKVIGELIFRLVTTLGSFFK